MSLNLNMFRLGIPSAYSSCPVKLLSFGPNKTVQATSSPRTSRTDTKEIKSKLNKIEEDYHKGEAASQTNIQADYLAFIQNSAGIDTSTPPSMEFLSVTDLEEPNNSKPTHIFLDVADIDPTPHGPLLDKYIESNKIEREKLFQEEQERLKQLEMDPLYEFKQTYEYKVNMISEQFLQLEKVASGLEEEMKKGEENIEHINKEYENELNEARNQVALKAIENMEKKIDLALVDDEATQIRKLIRSNSELYQDIDKSFSKPQKEKKKEEEKKKIKEKKRFYSKPLAPAVIPKAAGYQPQTKQAKNAVITHRVTRAMELAQQAIHLSSK